MPRSPGAGSRPPRDMSHTRPSAPSVSYLLEGLTLLFLCSSAVWGELGPGLTVPVNPETMWEGLGDCSLPPDIPNAQPSLGGVTSFPEKKTITYKCNEGFVKVPGKPDSVVCLSNKWSDVAEFCNRSCDVPTRLLFASLKKAYSKQNYFPAGSTVEYECRLGYKRDHSLSGKLTCLQDFIWSKPAEFCKKKACPQPEEIKNGHVNITTDILFGSPIFFSCNTGYTLVGATSSFCSLVGKNIGWSDPLPKCKEIICPEPPKIDNGKIKEEQHNYVYGQSLEYECTEGFMMVGKNSIQCTVKGDQGEWSGLPPKCEESPPTPKTPSASQKPTIVNDPATEPPPTAQKPTSSANVPANLPATEPPSDPQKPPSENLPISKPSLTVQKPTSANIPSTVVPPTPQKPTSANPSVTKVPATVQKPHISNALPTETSSAAQNPIVANASVAQAIPTAQRSSTTKASFTQSLSTKQRSTAVHAPVTKRLQTTHTSTPITATRGLAVPRATTRFQATSTSKGRGTLPSSGALILASDYRLKKLPPPCMNYLRDKKAERPHMHDTDSFTYDASSHWLASLTKEELRRKCTQVHGTFLVELELSGAVGTAFEIVFFVVHDIIVF
ncbi:PREDICTED: complement decay-accelerating factor [Chrysochloris asiatica]|uniref:Complement decay-accelerating factor n=1 Tax=Chrysochloris asiatica TaxID=185453 RepID=A0A9B0T2A4_CHRAS|nr:PREDICTED: complement decay-accelerating factor [Chrysochloris asiatica]